MSPTFIHEESNFHQSTDAALICAFGDTFRIPPTSLTTCCRYRNEASLSAVAAAMEHAPLRVAVAMEHAYTSLSSVAVTTRRSNYLSLDLIVPLFTGKRRP